MWSNLNIQRDTECPIKHRCQVSSFQTQSPAELGLTNFEIHVSYKLLFHKRKTVHDLRNHEIVPNCEILDPRALFFSLLVFFTQSDLGSTSF